MYIVVCFLLVYKFTDHYHRLENQLQLINIILYHIIRKTGNVLCNVTLRCGHVTIITVEMQQVLHIMSVCF